MKNLIKHINPLLLIITFVLGIIVIIQSAWLVNKSSVEQHKKDLDQWQEMAGQLSAVVEKNKEELAQLLANGKQLSDVVKDNQTLSTDVAKNKTELTELLEMKNQLSMVVKQNKDDLAGGLLAMDEKLSMFVADNNRKFSALFKTSNLDELLEKANRFVTVTKEGQEALDKLHEEYNTEFTAIVSANNKGFLNKTENEQIQEIQNHMETNLKNHYHAITTNHEHIRLSFIKDMPKYFIIIPKNPSTQNTTQGVTQ